MRSVIAGIVIVLMAEPVSAQVIFAPAYGPGFGGGFGYRSGFGFSVGGAGFRAYGYSRTFYGGPLTPYWVPVAGPGWGPGYGNPFFLSPPAGLAPPIFEMPTPIVIGNIDPNGAPNANPAPSRPVAGDYLVISPRQGMAQGPPQVERKKAAPEVKKTPNIDRVAPPPEKPQPQPDQRFDPLPAQTMLGKTDKSEADPIAEAARLVKKSQDAFSIGEYGQAAEYLEQAIRLKPDDSFPYFFRAQAQFAAGQYAEAVVSIREGMKLAPGWPISGFKSKDLYGDKPERLDAQIATLRAAQTANAAEPSLQFLLAYELWFVGDRPGAAALFRSAAANLKDTTIVERFLAALKNDGK